MALISFIVGDITALTVDAVIIPAHKHLIRGRGLSAQIFDKAGPELLRACSQYADSVVGDVRITAGFNLPARHIIHAVSPQWSGGDQYGGDALTLLSSCYRGALALAKEQHLATVAIASLGAGNNRFPLSLSARQGLEACREHATDFEEILICTSSTASRQTWLEVFDRFIDRQQTRQKAQTEKIQFPH